LSIAGASCLQLHDLKKCQPRFIEDSHVGPIRTLAFSPDGTRLASGGADRLLRIWDIPNNRLDIALAGHQNWIQSLAWSPDGRQLALGGGGDGNLRVWCRESKQGLRTLIQDKILPHPCFSFSDDGHWLASQVDDQSIAVWDIITGKRQYCLSQIDTWITSLAFCPGSSRYLVAAHQNDVIKIWDLERGEIMHEFGERDNGSRSLCFSSDGKRLLDGRSHQGQIAIYSCQGKQPSLIGTHTIMGDPTAIALSTRSNCAAIADTDKIEIVELVSGSLITTISGCEGRISVLAFSPDGSILAGGGSDGRVFVWNLRTQ
jgi:WD40 repeat protein